jgi:hypothetical protein
MQRSVYRKNSEPHQLACQIEILIRVHKQFFLQVMLAICGKLSFHAIQRYRLGMRGNGACDKNYRKRE